MGAHAVDPIRLTVETAVDAATAWLALTDPGRVAEWFTETSPLGTVGDPYRLDFGDGTVVVGRVRELDVGRSFAHDWHWEGTPDEETTLVRWSVEPRPEGGSRIVLDHEGWGAGDAATREDHAGYWAGYLDDLAALLAHDRETGG